MFPKYNNWLNFRKILGVKQNIEIHFDTLGGKIKTFLIKFLFHSAFI